MEPLIKSFAAKKAAFDPETKNTLRVIASGCGDPDRYGDVIMDGAWKTAVLKDFMQNGWIDIGHEWTGLPIAMPVEASVDGNDLVSACEFHSTDRGQEARTVCEERMAKGLSVSVSVGFMPDYEEVRWFDKGIDLLNWAKAAGYDLSKMDTDAIKALTYCRAIPKVDELFEWSIVCCGAYSRAKGLEMKSGPSPKDFEAHFKRSEKPADQATDSQPDAAERVAAKLRRAKLILRA